VHAFQAWNGQPRVVLYDNLKSAVLERRGTQILFNPRLVELTAHFTAQACQVRAVCIATAHAYARTVAWPTAIRKGAWNEPSAMCATPSGPDGPSLRWPNAIARLGSGVIKWRIHGAGRERIAALWNRPSPKSSPV
jgi:hypothetical protein